LRSCSDEDYNKQEDPRQKIVIAEGLWDVCQSVLGVVVTLLGALFGLQSNFRTLLVWAFVGLPCACRAKLQEARLMKMSVRSLIAKDFCGWKSYPSFPYISSASFAVDGFSHGNIVAEALLTTNIYSNELGVLWGTGNFSFLAQPLQWLGYGGLYLCALLVAAIFHIGILRPVRSALPIQASLAGFGALERQLYQELEDCEDSIEFGDTSAIIRHSMSFQEYRHKSAMLTFLLKFLAEALLFLQLSVSLGMAKAMKTGKAPTTDIGLSLNVLLASFAAAVAIKDVLKTYFALPTEFAHMRSVFYLCKNLVPTFVAMWIVTLKLYTFFRAGACPHKAWGLTTGCVGA
jgi:hypothetical protein